MPPRPVLSLRHRSIIASLDHRWSGDPLTSLDLVRLSINGYALSIQPTAQSLAARSLRWMETDYVVQSDPYGLEIEALDSLKLACCKVAVDACFLSSRIYCAGSGSVSC